jgi:acyl phosphate:glycerol-3-phosphate acyltransferase
MVQTIISIPLGYFLGSINWASIIAWLVARIDLRQEPDGRISASEVHHRLGMLPFFLVVFLDALFGAAAILLASYFSQGNLNVMMLAGIAALAGHNWSIFVKFKGGMGATAILGILIALISWQLLLGVAVAGIMTIITHKTTLSTIVGVTTISLTLLVAQGLGILPMYPLMLLSVMLLKRYQVKRLAQTAR